MCVRPSVLESIQLWNKDSLRQPVDLTQNKGAPQRTWGPLGKAVCLYGASGALGSTQPPLSLLCMKVPLSPQQQP